VGFDAPAGSAQENYLVIGSGWETSPETRGNSYAILGVHSVSVVTNEEEIVAIF
jgi:hypothetical protein